MIPYDGGSAFPSGMKATTVLPFSINGGPYIGAYVDKYTIHGGMSLRDYFAAKAMQGIVASIISGDCYERLRAVANDESMTLSAWISRDAYKQADAMLAEREKGGGE